MSAQPKPRNRRTKIVGAAAAAATLVAVGGTTFSLWSDKTDIDTGRDFVGGGLMVTTSQDGEWLNAATDQPVGTDTIDPGDRFVYREAVTPTLTGDIVADLTVGELNATGSPALLAALEKGRTVTVDGTVVDGPMRLTSADSATPVLVEVYVELPTSTIEGMGETITLEEIDVHLEQVTE